MNKRVMLLVCDHDSIAMATTDVCSNLESPLQVHEISVFAHELLLDFPQRSWTIYLEDNKSGEKSSQFTLLDPFSPVQYEELQWYMEDFALQDPFASDRAMRIAQSQTRYGRSLVASLRPHIDEIMLMQGKRIPMPSWGALHLLVFGDGTMNSLHSLRWELTERVVCCHPAAAITISRVSNLILTPPCDRKPNLDRPLNILYVSARPGLEEDISYRAISRQIWDLMEMTSEDPPQAKMEFVRPSTWIGFKTMLESRGPGYFDIVHFDMHGTVSRRAGKDTLVFWYFVVLSRLLTSQKCLASFF